MKYTTIDDFFYAIAPLEKEEERLRAQILAAGGNPPAKPKLQFTFENGKEVNPGTVTEDDYKEALEIHVAMLRTMAANLPAAQTATKPNPANSAASFTGATKSAIEARAKAPKKNPRMVATGLAG